MRKLLYLLAILPLFLSAQTKVDLYRQTRQVTKGTTPPATCTVGDLFFDTDATAGQNWFACTATNVWTLQSGSLGYTAENVANKNQNNGYAGLNGSGIVPYNRLGTGGDGSGTHFLADDNTFKTVSGGTGTGSTLPGTGYATNVITNGATCTVGSPCRAGFGATTYQITSSATATVTTQTGPTNIRLYIDSTGARRAQYNSAIITAISLSGFTADTSGTSFPAGSLPLATCATTGTSSPTISSCTNETAERNIVLTATAPLAVTPTAAGYDFSCPTCGTSSGSGGLSISGYLPTVTVPESNTGAAVDITRWTFVSGETHPVVSGSTAIIGSPLPYIGAVAYSATAINSMVAKWYIPTGWTGSCILDISIDYMQRSSGGSGNYYFDVSFAQFPADTNWTAVTWTTPVTLSAPEGSANIAKRATWSPITLPTCNANSPLFIKLRRLGNDAVNDTGSQDTELMGMFVTLRNQ